MNEEKRCEKMFSSLFMKSHPHPSPHETGRAFHESARTSPLATTNVFAPRVYEENLGQGPQVSFRSPRDEDAKQSARIMHS